LLAWSSRLENTWVSRTTSSSIVTGCPGSSMLRVWPRRSRTAVEFRLRS
jgi:hypothetical protein